MQQSCHCRLRPPSLPSSRLSFPQPSPLSVVRRLPSPLHSASSLTLSSLSRPKRASSPSPPTTARAHSRRRGFPSPPLSAFSSPVSTFPLLVLLPSVLPPWFLDAPFLSPPLSLDLFLPSLWNKSSQSAVLSEFYRHRQVEAHWSRPDLLQQLQVEQLARPDAAATTADSKAREIDAGAPVGLAKIARDEPCVAALSSRARANSIAWPTSPTRARLRFSLSSLRPFTCPAPRCSGRTSRKSDSRQRLEGRTRSRPPHPAVAPSFPWPSLPPRADLSACP